MIVPTPAPTTRQALDEVLAAADSARRPWARRDGAQRAAILRALAAALEAGARMLIPIAIDETHLPAERLGGELARTAFQLRLHADEIETGRPLDIRIDHADQSWGTGPRPDLRRIQVPLGPVIVFAASNFPFAFSVAGGDTSSALAAGCPVIVKSHPGHRRLSDATADIIATTLQEAGAPSGAFAIIHGDEAGRTGLLDPRIRAGASPARSLADARSLTWLYPAPSLYRSSASLAASTRFSSQPPPPPGGPMRSRPDSWLPFHWAPGNSARSQGCCSSRLTLPSPGS